MNIFTSIGIISVAVFSNDHQPRPYLFAAAQTDLTCPNEIKSLDSDPAIIEAHDNLYDEANFRFDCMNNTTVNDEINIMQCSYDFSDAKSFIDNFGGVCKDAHGKFVYIDQTITCEDDATGEDYSWTTEGIPYCIGQSCDTHHIDDYAQTLMQQDEDLANCNVDIEINSSALGFILGKALPSLVSMLGYMLL